VAKAIEGHHERIGLCYDTGHAARAGDDIVAGVRKVGKRVYGVHLKDVNEQKHDVIVGTGVLDIKGFLRALKEVGFKGTLMLEYELEPDNPIAGIQKSLAFVRQVLSELR
jgi:sugar phosphate isomerase/epimerase